MQKNIKTFLRENRPAKLAVEYLFTTDWKDSDANEGSRYKEVVFVDEQLEYRCYIDESMKNYSQWETWLHLAEKGVWYTVKLLYLRGAIQYKRNVVYLNGDGIPKQNKDIDPDPKKTHFDFTG